MTQSALVLLATSFFAQAQQLLLQTADTSISLQATPEAPRLIRLALIGGAVWENRGLDELIHHVEIGGVVQPVHWQFQSNISGGDPNIVRFVYDSQSPRLRLYWEWRRRARHGPIEHTIRIENLNPGEIWLPLQDSVRFDFHLSRERQVQQFWVEKGASAPSTEGTHAVLLQEGGNWTGTSSTYAHPAQGLPREIIPYLLVEPADYDRSGWYLGIEFSGRTRITLRRQGESIAGVAGLNPNPGPYRTRLAPGESFETPAIFLGAFKGGPDGAGNVLRPWIREVLNNPQTLRNTAYPLLVSNSWGTGMAIDEEQGRRMIRDASALGMEMFHLDAGWFRGVGDWVSDPQKFPHGVQSLANYAHQAGLRFGLWTDWTQAGFSNQPGALNVHDPKVRDWLITNPPDGWKPHEFKGITIDIGVPAARQWAQAAVTKLVGDFHLDMLEHDGYLVAQGCDRPTHPHASLEESTARRYTDEDYLWVEGSNSTDVSDRATRAYYEIQAALRRRYPELLLEICNDGGRMVDFGTAANGDYFSITDAYDPVSNRRAFFDASYVLPAAMLETYVEKWPAPTIQNFRYVLRSGMMGWFSLMQDSSEWTAQQHAAARDEFALYKSRLRPLIRDADLYHISNRPDGVHWDGMEFFDPKIRRGAIFAFRGSSLQSDSHAFPLRGLRKNTNYRITFQDGSSRDYTTSADRLTKSGVTVRLSVPNSSELVFFGEVK